MKHPVNSFRYFLIPLLTASFFVSCTILDNDLRDLPDNPAYREIVHEEGKDYSVDYQLQPWTIIVDESYEKYVADVDYENSVVYLYDYIPEDLLPKEGNSLAARVSDKLEWGLSYKVKKVRREGSLYVVDVERAEIEDMYKYLKLTQDQVFGVDDDEDISEQNSESDLGEMTRASDKDKKNDHVFGPGGWSIDMIDAMAAVGGALAEKGGFIKNEQFKKFLAALATKAVATKVSGVDGTVHLIKIVPENMHEARTLEQLMQEEAKAVTQPPLIPSTDMPGETQLKEQLENERKASADKRAAFYNKLAGSSSLTVDAAVKFVVNVKPSIRIKSYIFHPDEKDKNNKSEYKFEFDVSGTIGTDFYFSGYVNFEVDLLELLCALLEKNRFQFVKSAPLFGIPVWVQFKPLLNYFFRAGGEINVHADKFFRVGVGYRRNIKKEEDGTYFITDNPSTEMEWKMEHGTEKGFSGTGSVESGIKFIPHTVFGIGIPPADVIKVLAEDGWNALGDDLQKELEDKIDKGINITMEFDPSITAKVSGSFDDTGQIKWGFSVPLSWKDAYLVFRPWPSIELSWNVGEAVLNAMGGKGEKMLYNKEWYAYPHGTVGATCTNFRDTDYPKFSFEYVLDDIGAFYDEKKPYRPVLKVLNENDKAGLFPIYTYEMPFLKKSDELKHFRTELDDPRMERDKIYIARIEMLDKNGKARLTDDTEFTSVTPSARISPYKDDVKLIYWEGKYWDGRFYNEGKSWTKERIEPIDCQCAVEFNYKFYTKVYMQNYEEVDQLGFYAGKENKRFVCQGKPKSSFAYCLWDMTVRQPVYKLSIRPFAAFKASDDRTLENIWPEPYTLEYNFYDLNMCPRDPDFGGNGIAYKKYPSTPNALPTHYCYGKDETQEFYQKMQSMGGKELDVIAKEKSAESRQVGTYVGEKDGIPVYLFKVEPEDLE